MSNVNLNALMLNEQLYKLRNYKNTHLYLTTETSSFYVVDCSTGSHSYLEGPSKSPITSLKLYESDALFTTLKGEIFVSKLDTINVPFMTLNCKFRR